MNLRIRLRSSVFRVVVVPSALLYGALALAGTYMSIDDGIVNHYPYAFKHVVYFLLVSLNFVLFAAVIGLGMTSLIWSGWKFLIPFFGGIVFALVMLIPWSIVIMVLLILP